MRFCSKHWGALRQAIQVRGLGDFVAGSGVEALAMTVSDLKDGDPMSKTQYDPLMGAHNTIVRNTMIQLQALGFNPLAIFGGDPEHPECDCPICYLNFLSLEHDRTCDHPNCAKPKGMTFDDWIDKAADGSAAYLKTLK